MTRTIYHVFDKALHRPSLDTFNIEEAYQWFEELATEGLLARMQESDDGGETWRDTTDDVIETLSDEWLDNHHRSEWQFMPNWVWGSTAWYRRENGAA